MEKMTIVIDGFGNAAFEDNTAEETARILRKLADKIENDEPVRTLWDINGNIVGRVITE